MCWQRACDHASQVVQCPHFRDQRRPAHAALARSTLNPQPSTLNPGSSILPNRLSRGTAAPIPITTTSDAKPPRTTDVTVPNSFAATPDSNAPSSFDEPTKIEFTDDTLPSRCDGVSTCSNVERMSTLT